MQAGWRGFYINLDRSTDRRAAMEGEIARAGLAASYRRFPAVGGEGRPAASRLSPGQYGCFRSHHDVLAAAPAGGFVHVMEDDVVMAPGFAEAMQSVIAGHAMDSFDIVFTETMIGGDPPLIRMLKALFEKSVGEGRPLTLSVLDLRNTILAGATSYLVNPRSHRKVVESLARGLASAMRPVDLHIADEVRAGRLKAGLLFPFITSLNAALPSTVAPEDASTAATLLLRNSFYVGRDLAASRRQMEAIVAGAGLRPGDAHLDLIGDILRFFASDKFRQF